MVFDHLDFVVNHCQQGGTAVRSKYFQKKPESSYSNTSVFGMRRINKMPGIFLSIAPQRLEDDGYSSDNSKHCSKTFLLVEFTKHILVGLDDTSNIFVMIRIKILK